MAFVEDDGKDRAIDNVLTERLGRSIKYENIFLKGYESMADAQSAIAAYVHFYNSTRLPAALNDKTPDSVYSGKFPGPANIVGKKILKRAA